MLGNYWTPLTRNVLATLFGIYVVQLVLQGALEIWLAWWPIGQGFMPWQLLTSYLLGSRDPLGTVLDWMGIFFFLSPVAYQMGPRRFWQALGTVWALSSLLGLGLSAVGVLQQSSPFVGLAPLLAALVAWFGFLNPSAQILLIVFPVRAIWLAWGSGLLAFLYMLATREVSAGLTFFGWGTAWLWLQVLDGGLRRLQLRWQRRNVEKKLRRFDVVEGGRSQQQRRPRSNDDDWVN